MPALVCVGAVVLMVAAPAFGSDTGVEKSRALVVRSASGGIAGVPGDIACEQTVSGELDPSDTELSDGTWIDSFTFTLTETTTVTFTLAADDFDPYLFVDDVDDNNFAAGFSPQTVTLPPGDYLVFPNNFDPLADGSYPYLLTLSCKEPSETFQIECGETVSGALDPNDTELSDGTWTDSYSFTLTEETTVTFTLEADDFGPWLIVNDFAEGFSPQTVTLPRGDYLVFPNNFDPLPDGSYPYDLTMTCDGESGCPGDCDGDGEVVISELIRGVNIALGSATVDDCPAFDRDGDGTVAINELVQGVNAALDACFPV